jgi:hypothetical protein
MKKDRFPHHQGGVIHVEYSSRWGTVPEALLEDTRLDLDSRAVAAWLSIKPKKWQINVDVLRKRVAYGTQDMLGKDRWQKIAGQLEAAGYLIRRKINGTDGRWLWFITFNPVPSTLTEVGFPDPGKTITGQTDAGESGNKDIPKQKLTTLRNNTTLAQTQAKEEQIKSDQLPTDESGNLTKSSPLIFDRHIVQFERILVTILRSKKIDLNSRLAQNLLDELAGAVRAGLSGDRYKINEPSRWFQAVVNSVSDDNFEGIYFEKVQNRRAQEIQKLQQKTTEITCSSPAVARANIERMYMSLRTKQIS